MTMTVSETDSHAERKIEELTDLIDWMGQEKVYVYPGNRLEAFFTRLGTLLVEAYPEKQEVIDTSIKTILDDDRAGKYTTRQRNNLVRDIVIHLAGRNKNGPVERELSKLLDDHWQTVKNTAPVSQAVDMMRVHEEDSIADIKEIMDGKIDMYFALTGDPGSQEQVLARNLLTRLGFQYLNPGSGKGPHFWVSQGTVVASGHSVPVLQLPPGSLSLSNGGYDQEWLIALLHAIGQFMGMPVLDDHSSASRIRSLMAPAVQWKRMFAAYPDLAGLLEGKLKLSDNEATQYLAHLLIHSGDASRVDDRVYNLMFPQFAEDDQDASLSREELEQKKFDEELLTNSYTKEDFLLYLEIIQRESDRGVTPDIEPSADELVNYAEAIQEELMHYDTRQFLHYASKTQSEERYEALRQQVIKFAVIQQRPRDAHGHLLDLAARMARLVAPEHFPALDALIDSPRTYYGEFFSIQNAFTVTDKLLNYQLSYPGYSHGDGRVRVYTYTFSDSQDRAEEVAFVEIEEIPGVHRVSLRPVPMTAEQERLVEAGLTEIAQLAAVSFRKAEQGELADIDFAVYRENEVISPLKGKFVAMAGGVDNLPQKRIRFSDELTFGENEGVKRGTIQHEILHVLGLNHPNTVFSEDLPSSVMATVYPERARSIQPFDKLMSQLIHGPNPDSENNAQYVREAQKIWKARDAWVTDIPLNTTWREPYIVSGMLKNGQSAIEVNAEGVPDIHSGLSIQKPDERTWALRFQDGKEVLVTGMNGEPLRASDLNVIVWYDKNTAYRLHPPENELSLLKWTGFSWQNGKWVEIPAQSMTPQEEGSLESTVSDIADQSGYHNDEDAFPTNPVIQGKVLPVEQIAEHPVSAIVNRWENDPDWKALSTDFSTQDEAMPTEETTEPDTGQHSHDVLLQQWTEAGTGIQLLAEAQACFAHQSLMPLSSGSGYDSRYRECLSCYIPEKTPFL